MRLTNEQIRVIDGMFNYANEIGNKEEDNYKKVLVLHELMATWDGFISENEMYDSANKVTQKPNLENIDLPEASEDMLKSEF